MRVALISGSYRPGYSYQENIWAEQLAARGDAVRVFAPGPRAESGLDPAGYPVQRVPTRGLSARNLYLTARLAPAVRAFDPQLILWFGPPQLFGVDVAVDPRLRAVPLVAFMGQNRQMHTFDWRDRAAPHRERALAAAYRVIRGPAIAVAAARAQAIVANTPETPEIVLSLLPRPLRGRAEARMRAHPLGFDPATFGWQPALRASARPALSVPDDAVVVVVSSRFAPEKLPTLELACDALERAMDHAPRVYGLVVGFSPGPVAEAIGGRLDGSRHRDRLRRRPFGGRQALSGLLHAADVAVFARPSISAQEALGTGVYAVLADGGSMDWLLDHPSSGRFFPAGDRAALAEALVAACAVPMGSTARTARAGRARRLGYDRVIDAVLASIRG